MDKRDCFFPDMILKPEDVTKQLKINADVIMKEINDHIDSELRRFSRELHNIKNEDRNG